mmetsp:Transcript_162321/g.515713  ORF Transcript_162321/g.515713 Transcript_162321/m.515713 type:complete len:117 (+) Transcript_162321:2446-2796(+)
MMLSAFSRPELAEDLADVWALLERREAGEGPRPSALCLGAPLMECEQRRRFPEELALLRRLAACRGGGGAPPDSAAAPASLLGEAAACAAALRLLSEDPKLFFDTEPVMSWFSGEA